MKRTNALLLGIAIVVNTIIVGAALASPQAVRRHVPPMSAGAWRAVAAISLLAGMVLAVVQARRRRPDR